MGTGPLDHPRLLEIEDKLDRAELDAAQRLLADLGDAPVHRTAITYFATRLLYQRGRLDAPGVVVRLRELVRSAPDFPQAQAMLGAAEQGTLRPDPEGFMLATAPPTRQRSAELDESAEAPPKLVYPSWPLARSAQASARPAQTSAAPAPTSARPAQASVQSGQRSAPPVQLSAPPPPTSVPVAPPEQPSTLPPPSVVPARSSVRPVPPSIEVSGSSQQPSRTSPRPPAFTFPRPPIMPTFAESPHQQPSYAPDLPLANAEDDFTLELPRVTLPGPGPARILPGAPSHSGPIPRDSTRPRRPKRKIEANSPAPTALSIATQLDQKDFAGALAELARIEAATTPELTLLKARALLGSDSRELALSALARIEHAPLLEPDLRSGAARLLIEMGEPARALVQARHAHQDDPEAAMVRLTLAWALIRSAWRSPTQEAIEEAERMLHELRARKGPMPALVQALRACVLAERGDPERAITTAQLALGFDSHSIDALAAISIASARLERTADAQKAWLRLLEANPEEADWLGDRLEQLGVPLADLNPSSPAPRDSSAARMWDKAEVELSNGDREHAIQSFEQDSARELRGLVGDSATDAIPLLATMAANFLTSAPLFRHFAPYDLSLWSIARVEAALDVLYGRGPRAALASDDYPARVMLATYLGECLRHAYDGKWTGSLAVPDDVLVQAGETSWAPFRELRARIQQGKRIYFDTPGLHHPGTEPYAQRTRVQAEPPCPWDPAQWPSPRIMARLASAFAQSVVHRYCSEFAEGPLDRSLSGLSAVDTYVALIAPPKAPPHGPERWSERAAVLIGAYLGEVLCDAIGAHWFEGAASAAGPESYVLILPDGNSTLPVRQALDRLTGKRLTPLSEYAARFARPVSMR
jgi:tetratricopeptide (TPR) repeat protein